MHPIPLVTSSDIISVEKYWNVMMLYHDRPHIINRKITAVSQVLFCNINFNSNVKLQELINRHAILYELRKLKELKKETISYTFLKNLLEPYDSKLQLEETNIEKFKNCYEGVFISLRILYPRIKNCHRAIEIVILDKNQSKVTFLAVADSNDFSIAPPFSYEIELTISSILKINLKNFEDADTNSASWLADKLFPKLLKWIDSFNSNGNQACITSLSLIDADEYCLTYNKVKDKYGPTLVKEWPKRCGTDPQKFVFEDIAIASYLICLWKCDSNINFVDCGCGNGLLVYLLNQEGYEGFGLDIRERGIWDIYPKTTKLQIKAVTPSSLFPSTTWILGNHSDELTPWIPIIASKSSPNTNFFVLPCCPFDLNGKKFIRTNTSLSTYTDYLKYIEKISILCGFEVDIDKLRIPSTKRTCFIGRRKKLDECQYQEILLNIAELLKEKVPNGVIQRDVVDRVRNCTQLDKSLIKNIINMCVEKLLSSKNYIKSNNSNEWNRGIEIHLSELVQAIPDQKLKQMKKECGGFQTLLKNHQYIFELKKGLVQLRLPLTVKDSLKYKNKPCWFLKNHPDGCLHNADECCYSHE